MFNKSQDWPLCKINADFDLDSSPDYIFITYGNLVGRVCDAADALRAGGMNVGVIIVETIKPYGPVADKLLPIIQKAKRNAELSGIPNDRIRYIADDCFKFVAREIRRGNKYDAIILDPPSFGRGPNGEKWVIEESLDEFVGLVCQVLSDNPLFVLLNSYTTGLSPATNGYILRKHTKRFGGSVISEELGLPIEESQEYLPCGAASRWTPDNF